MMGLENNEAGYLNYRTEKQTANLKFYNQQKLLPGQKGTKTLENMKKPKNYLY